MREPAERSEADLARVLARSRAPGTGWLLDRQLDAMAGRVTATVLLAGTPTSGTWTSGTAAGVVRLSSVLRVPRDLTTPPPRADPSSPAAPTGWSCPNALQRAGGGPMSR